MVRLENRYKEEIVPKMVDRFAYKNVNSVPCVTKITVNMGIGKAIENHTHAGSCARKLVRSVHTRFGHSFRLRFWATASASDFGIFIPTLVILTACICWL